MVAAQIVLLRRACRRSAIEGARAFASSSSLIAPDAISRAASRAAATTASRSAGAVSIEAEMIPWSPWSGDLCATWGE